MGGNFVKQAEVAYINGEVHTITLDPDVETEERGQAEHVANENEVHKEMPQFEEEIEEEELLHSGEDQTSEEEEEDADNGDDAKLREKQMARVKNKNKTTTDELLSDEEDEGVSSQYYDSDEPPSYYSESEKEEVQISEVQSKVQERHKVPSYNPASESKELELDMLFEDGIQFKTALINYAVHNKRDIRWVKNEPRRIQAQRENKKCPFKCTTSWAEQYKCIQMKTWVGTHRCNEKFKLKIVSQKWLEDKFENKIRDNPSIGVFCQEDSLPSDLGSMARV
ncbi:unnamed protein product [Cuscuta europaea]|uniref:Transposase MuDR plant domain-containing protein n=1 Tax=Cuscuta europaea TaxID=41803 RepID=A0A9P1EJ54_CUSEU|nr:unnamed protein product [Cuscuta europaea]